MKSGHRQSRRASLGRRALRLLLGTFAVLMFGAGVLLAAGVAFALVTYDEYADQYVPPDLLSLNQPSRGAKIYDRNGTLLYEYVDDEQGLRKPVKLGDVSPHLIAATIATEDASFFSNPGFNLRGLVRAGLESVNSLLSQGDIAESTGGSSITQQLIKNAYVPTEARSDRTIDRKLRELVYASELTKSVSKEQILEWYVNEINYGGIYSGIEAASEGYFGKTAKELSLGEAALLAGVPQSPSALDPRFNLDAAVARRNEVLDLLSRHPSIDIGGGATYTVNPDEIAAARVEQVSIREEWFPIKAPHFVLSYIVPQLEQMFGKDALLHDGLVVTTTLDLELQDRAQRVLEHWISEFERVSNTHNGATMVLDPKTGEVLVMLGSRDYFRDDISGAVNNLLAGNSPGSTFKPFVYLTGFVKKNWTPGTMIEDSPISYREVDGTVFSPTNPGGGAYHGPLSVRDALGNSLNVPAFKAALEIGVPNILTVAKSMGFTSLGDSYGPSIALGGVDFKPFDLTYAYSVLANGGMMIGQDTLAPDEADERMLQPVGILQVTDTFGKVRYDVEDHRRQEQVVDAEDAYLITDILSDPNARCITFGCGGLMVPGYRVAVKTGTSEPFDPQGPNRGKIGETWAFGYTPDLVVSIWAGNSNNAPIDHIFSTSISYRAMRDIMLEAYKGREVTSFETPDGLVRRESCSVPQPPQLLPNQQPQANAAPPVCTSELGVR